jgi:hypothetical protein
MLNSNDFRLFSVQAAAFTPKTDDFKSSRVIAKLVPLISDRYDGRLTTSGPPHRIEFSDHGVKLSEKLVFASDDDRWKFEVVPQRADSYWQSLSQDGGRGDLREICSQCLKALREYPIADETQIGRLALVVRRWIPHENPGVVLSEQFCKHALVDEADVRAPFRHSQAFQLHNLKKYETPLDNIVVNSWVRCRSDIQVHNCPAVTIEQDLNTLHEELESHAFHPAEIERYFEWAVEEVDKVLDLYFPGNP